MWVTEMEQHVGLTVAQETRHCHLLLLVASDRRGRVCQHRMVMVPLPAPFPDLRSL